MAYWVGSYDTTGANTAVKFVVSGIKLLILAMDFFAGERRMVPRGTMRRWRIPIVNCYITTHAWLTVEWNALSAN